MIDLKNVGKVIRINWKIFDSKIKKKINKNRKKTT